MASVANTLTLSTNFNVSPYYDDFDETKNFHRVLFRPGLGVQARELTQMQTILQNQIDRFAEHIFKEGSAVRGCEVVLDNKYDYVKLRNNTNTGANTDVTVFTNLIFKGTTSGVLGKVVDYATGSEAGAPNYKTIFVDYISANTTTGYKEFANNEILTCVTNSALKANTIVSSATGFGSAVKLASGIIFAKDHFIRVDDQTLILDKYTNNPTYRVGYEVAETIISSSDDSTLLDPASGSYNYAAPGANRLKLTPTLAKKTESDTFANNFIELLNVKNGIIQSKAKNPDYNILRDELAKRTREESGDYIVKGLNTRVREHLLVGNNQGVFTVAEGGSATKLSIDVEPGKAYIQGYDNELIVTQHVAIDKAVDFNSAQEVKTYTDIGNYIVADNVVGSWDLNNQTLVSLRGRVAGSAQVNAVATGSYSSATAPGTEIGTARVRGLELRSGIPGSAEAQYNLYLTDIRIKTTNKSFANVECITWADATNSMNGRADILNATNRNANTVDPFFRTAVFRLPAKAVKTLRDTGGNIDSEFQFYKAFNAVSFSTSGTLTLDTTSENGSASETLSGSGALSSTLARERFTVIVRSAANTSNLTGTISMSGNTVTGSGTAFTTQLNVGDVISTTGTNKFVISAITSDTAAEVHGAGATTGGAYHKRFLVGQHLDVGGNGRDGARSVTINSTTSATIDINETTSAGFNATVIAKLNMVNVGEATKTINRDRYVQINVGAGGGTSYTANTTGPWPLGLGDALRVVSVRKKSGSNFSSTTEGTDVTSHFVFDNGQRDSYYDHAQLVKKPNSTLSVASGDRLLVKLDYFTHSNRNRGYFSINSYPVDDTYPTGANVAIYQVPVFTSPTTGVSYDLRDCVDFRPRLTDSANSVTSLTNISINPLGISTPSARLTTPAFDTITGGLHSPYPGAYFETDLDYYLRRKDLIVMDKTGRCESIRGVPSVTPKLPASNQDKMTLAQIDLAPYPSLPDEIARRNNRTDLANSLRAIKNERFTMRDIGVIRDRVERLEYYTTLSLLEKDAKDTVIVDENGVDRFKNGFLVDGFTGHAVGNVYDPEYKISIDPSRKEARPQAKIDNIELFYSAADSTNISRTNVLTTGVSRDQYITISNSQVAFSNGSTITGASSKTATVRYKFDNKLYLENATGNFAAAETITSGALSATVVDATRNDPGKLLTLPYKHERVIYQPFASTTRNLSGLFYNWIGIVTIDPNSDYWVDTVKLPDVQVNIDNGADNWEALSNAYGTQWSSWETVATGVPVLVSTEAQTSVVTETVLNTSEVVGDGTRIGGPIQIDTTTTSTIQVDSTTSFNEVYSTESLEQRVGTEIGVSLSTQQQTVGDIVRDVNIQPFMRSRIIRVSCNSFKPSSKLYAFFDGIDVSDYITPTNSSFANTANEGSQLTTNSSGNAYALFRIPSDDTLKFRIGEKVLRLSDSPTNSSVVGQVTTAGQAVYAAQGLTLKTSDLTISTTVSEIAVNTVQETRSVQQIDTVQRSETTSIIREDVSIRTEIVDPICQTFFVDTSAMGNLLSSGAFLSKVDLYFSEKDSTQPLIVEIREVDPASGYPTPKILPYGRAIVSSSSVNTSTDGSKPTVVYFPSPVYVQNGKQYALCLIPGGGNPNYRAWISRLGDNDLITGNRISSQPAAGMLFASSNDRTYTALQEEDLKFNVYFANYVVSTTGTLILKNENRDFFTVANVSSDVGFSRAGEEVHGETLLTWASLTPGQNWVGNVALTNSYVQGITSGATGRVTFYSSANNEMRLRSVSTNAKFKGGESIRLRIGSPTGGTLVSNGTISSATYPVGKTVYYAPSAQSNTYLHVANVTFANSGTASAKNRTFLDNRWVRSQVNGVDARIVSLDSLNADLVNVKGDYIIPSNTSITPSAKFATSISARDSAYISINMNSDTVFASRRYIHSESAESNTNITSSTMKEGSAEIKFAFVSNNRYGSPVFDTSRISATIVENLLNNVTTTEGNAAFGGAAKARYITRKVVLAENQDAEDLKVYLDAYVPPGSAVNVYYKILNGEDSDSFKDAKWQEMTRLTTTNAVSDSENRNDFRELEFQPGEFDSPNYSGLYANSAPSGSTNVLAYRNSEAALFFGFKFFAIKVVLTGTTTTNPPRIRNLRAIALQK